MSAVSNVLAGGLPQGFGPASTPPQPGNPLTQQAPPPQPQTYVDADFAPPQPEALALDPYVMDTPVKIRCLGASRMLARPILAQQFQFLAPLMLNGPVLEQLALQGETFDMVEFFRLAQDATGLGKTYRFLKPLSPEQQQARSQPPPAVQAQIQKAQLDNQGRSAAVQSKERIETQRMQMEAALKDKQISEESARHVLDVHAKMQASQPDPHEQMMQVLAGQQKLKQSASEAQLRQQSQAQQNQQKLQFAQQSQLQKLQHQAQQHRLDLMQTTATHQQTQSHRSQEHSLSQTQTAQTHHLAQATTQAQNRQDLGHQILMNLMDRQKKEHEVVQAKKLAAMKPAPVAGKPKSA